MIFILWLLVSIILFSVFVFMIKYGIEKGELYKHDEMEMLGGAVGISIMFPVGICVLIGFAVKLGLEKISEWEPFKEEDE